MPRANIEPKRDVTIRLREVFSRDNAELVEEYIAHVRRILLTKDNAFFVARKGICFFYALESNGYFDDIRNESGKYPCQVFSTRVLSYSHEQYDGVSAIIDDVMVSGKAMRHALDNLGATQDQGVECLVGASCASLLSKDEGVSELLSRVKPIRQMKRVEVLEYARQITQYIQASGISNNIDHPVFDLRMHANLLVEDVLAGMNAVNVSTGAQRHYHISSYTVTFNPEAVLSRELLGSVDSPEGLVAKCRIVARPDEQVFTCVPIIILPEITEAALEMLFSRVASPRLRRLCANQDYDEELKNKLRITQYALSYQLGRELAEVFTGTELLPGGQKARLAPSRVKAVFGAVIVGELYGQNFIADHPSFVGLTSDCVSPHCIRDAVGRIRTEALVDAAVNMGEGSDKISVTGADVVRYVSVGSDVDNDRVLIDHSPLLLASLCLDSLIDSGVFIPYSRVLQRGKTRLVARAYHGGEIERMTDERIAQFALFLHYLQGTTKQSAFDANVVGALGVIFARYKSFTDGLNPPSPNEPFSYSFDKQMWGLRAGEASDQRGKPIAEVLAGRGYARIQQGRLVRIAKEESALFDLVMGSVGDEGERRGLRIPMQKLARCLYVGWCLYTGQEKWDNSERLLEYLCQIIIGHSYRYVFGILRNDIDTISNVLKDGSRYRAMSELENALSSAIEKLQYRDSVEEFINGLYKTAKVRDEENQQNTNEMIVSDLEDLLNDPYCYEGNDGTLARLYTRIAQLLRQLDRSPKKSDTKSFESLEYLMFSDGFEKCSAALNALFGGSDLQRVPVEQVRETWSSEFQSFMKSKTLAIQENPFSYCKRDLVAIGLKGSQAGQTYPQCQFVVHDYTGGTHWGEELEGAVSMRNAHAALLFLSPEACISVIDSTAQLVDQIVQAGKLSENYLVGTRLVRAVNQFFVDNATSAARYLVTCEIVGKSFGFDKAMKNIGSEPTKATEEHIRKCLRRHLEPAVDAGVLSTIAHNIQDGSAEDERTHIIGQLRKATVIERTKGLWVVGDQVSSCPGAQHLSLTGLAFNFYRIEG